MKITIKSIRFKVSEQLESYIKDKVKELFKMNEEIIWAEVKLYELSTNNLLKRFCEIQLSVSGNNHFVKKESDSYEHSILEAVENLQSIFMNNQSQNTHKGKWSIW